MIITADAATLTDRNGYFWFSNLIDSSKSSGSHKQTLWFSVNSLCSLCKNFSTQRTQRTTEVTEENFVNLIIHISGANATDKTKSVPITIRCSIATAKLQQIQ